MSKVNKLKEKIMSTKAIRHGEVLLQPVTKFPKGKLEEHKTFIVGHSETGHHHVLESTNAFKVLTSDKDSLWVEVLKPAKLVHKKSVDAHQTLPVKPGKYQIIYKTEYDPFQKIIRQVQD